MSNIAFYDAPVRRYTSPIQGNKKLKLSLRYHAFDRVFLFFTISQMAKESIDLQTSLLTEYYPRGSLPPEIDDEGNIEYKVSIMHLKYLQFPKFQL